MNQNAAASAHQTIGSRAISSRALLIIVPKLVVDGSTPTPTYDSTASASTRPEKSITSEMMMMCITLGRMCRPMMREWLTPNACAAWMYSSSRSLRASPRRRRASPVQLVSPRMMHRNRRRRSARSAVVGNSSGCVSM